MSTTRTIRIEGSGNQRTIVRPVGPPGPAGVAGTPGTMTGPVGATANAIVLFNGTTGSVVKDSTVTLSSLATTAAVTAALALKQDAEAGKGLSQQNFTTTLKAKLDALGTATYKGSHATLSDLAAAHPAGAAGDWAHVEVLVAALLLDALDCQQPLDPVHLLRNLQTRYCHTTQAQAKAQAQTGRAVQRPNVDERQCRSRSKGEGG